METKIRWGIVGPGKIATKFVSDLRLVDNAALSGVASRNLGRAKAFAKEYNITHAFGSYDELFRSDVVDVMYIDNTKNLNKDLSTFSFLACHLYLTYRLTVRDSGRISDQM